MCICLNAPCSFDLFFSVFSSYFLFYQDNPSEKDMNQGTLVVFNLDSSISIDELHQIFGVYGEIKEVIGLRGIVLVFTFIKDEEFPNKYLYLSVVCRSVNPHKGIMINS